MKFYEKKYGNNDNNIRIKVDKEIQNKSDCVRNKKKK